MDLHHNIWLILLLSLPSQDIIATFRLEYEDDYEYEVTVLSMRFRLAGRKFSKCECSVL